MPISCRFRDCKALLVTSLTQVSGAIASVQTFTFTYLQSAHNCSNCPPWALTQAERRRRHWLTAASTVSIRLTVSVSVLQDVIKITWSQDFVGNATAVVSRVDSGINPPNFIKFHQVLNKIMQKKTIRLCFCGHSVVREWQELVEYFVTTTYVAYSSFGAA